MKKLPAWAILTIIAMAAGLLLSVTNSVTLPIIQAGALAEAQATRAGLFPEAEQFEAVELTEDSGLDNCYQALRGGEVAGHVAQITVNGFGGPIEIMLGMDLNGAITGVSVGGADFKETAGLGARTKEPDFTKQFTGAATPVELGTDVDAVTGATISSKAVADGVNAIAEYITSLEK